jgi:hypothetical protein
MRADSVGFFWDDTPPPKPPKKEKEKRTPPEATWLADDYLPGLDEALAFPVHIMTDPELAAAQAAGEELVLDCEVYRNYFLAMFTSMTTGWVYFVEVVDGVLDQNQIMRLGWILHNFQTTGFNSLDYDLTVCALALAGQNTSQIKDASDQLIVEEKRPTDVLRARKVKKLKLNHIDIIEVAPLAASLKTYAGRLHAPKIQDLPFPPATILSYNQIAIVRWYCVNDTVGTAFVRQHQQEHISLRIQLGKQYGLDLRSKSDAQIAEAIIASEIGKVTGERPKAPGPLSAVGTKFFYKPPAYIQFQTPELRQALAEMCAAEITVGPSGHCIAPDAIREQKVSIAGKPYTVGMGGLHSKEKRQAVIASPNMRVIDRDVTGYYPDLILRNGFAPAHLGHVFLVVLQALVDRRTNAKDILKTLDKFQAAYEAMNAEAGGLKITNNGIFGKTSDPWSIVYAPKEMVQITITGQLSLLMAIEALELSGIPVVSANTDGIVMACPTHLYDHMHSVFAWWEQTTSLKTEETEYKGLYAANVNNYIALMLDGKTKTKGWYCERGSAQNSVLSKNPDVLICSEAVQAYLSKQVPLEQTIRACTDIRKFVSVRLVRGGGVKVWGDGRPNEYLGKTVRWYYGYDVPGEIVYAASGNKVPRSENALPCMELPKRIPNDLDYGWYVAKAESMMRDIGAWAD